jgi:hypothetical protein
MEAQGGQGIVLLVGSGSGGLRREQRATFQQAAEIFFARVMMFTAASFEFGERHIADFEPFEFDDADEFIAVFPDLTLSKF